MKKNFLDQHECEAVVLICMDFRFHKDLCKYIKKEMGIFKFDLLAMAGSAKDLINDGLGKEAILRDFKISKDLHKADKIVIVHHIDCGAYGGSQAFGSHGEEVAFHMEQLEKAEKIIKSNLEFSDMEVILVFINRIEKGLEYLRV